MSGENETQKFLDMVKRYNIDRCRSYVERLQKEWLTYGKIIIAVDFDSTVSPWGNFQNHSDIDRCITLLVKARQVGCYIVVHTSCNTDRYEEIRQTFRAYDLEIDSINQNPFELPYGNRTKPYYNILLDDRAGFIESMDMLEKAIYNTIGARKPHLDDVA